MTAPKRDREERPPTQATVLLDLVSEEKLYFFHSPEKECFVLAPVEKHVETLPLRGRGFPAWLRGRYYAETGKAANAQAVSDALGVLEQRALQGECAPVSVRIASDTSGVVYLDLGRPDWRVVEVTAHGWSLIEGAEATVYFRRPGGLLELPEPKRGGSVEELRSFVNVGSDADWRLMLGWVVAALRRFGPYPVLVLLGEQGSAKSTTARVLRRTIDPNKADLRAEPRSEDDLVIAATNGWALTLDNVSALHPWLSDALCRVSTGAGLGKRKLWTDGEEALFDVARPILVNGIGDILSRPDLLDRSLLLTLPRLDESKRRREAELWRAFNEAHPRILGALLDALVVALRDEEATASSMAGTFPRLADASCWIEAAAPALGWQRGDFHAALTRNREDVHEIALEASPVALAVQTLMESRPNGYSGTATELLEALTEHASDAVRKSKLWPVNGRALTNALLRAAPTLRAVGVDLEQTKDSSRQRRRLWLLMQREGRKDRPDRPHRPNVSETDGLASDARNCASSAPSAGPSDDALASDASGRNVSEDRPTLSARPDTLSDGTDATDASAPTPSTSVEWPEAEPLASDLY